MEPQIVELDNLDRLVALFCDVEQRNFENALDPLVDMVSKSARVALALSDHDRFLRGLARRLMLPRAIVRKNLLQMLRMVLRQSSRPIEMVQHYGLKPMIHSFSKDSAQVLVMEIANQLIQDINSWETIG